MSKRKRPSEAERAIDGKAQDLAYALERHANRGGERVRIEALWGPEHTVGRLVSSQVRYYVDNATGVVYRAVAMPTGSSGSVRYAKGTALSETLDDLLTYYQASS